ncbi:MAG: hypothetical protein R6W70_07355 [bacterium]
MKDAEVFMQGVFWSYMKMSSDNYFFPQRQLDLPERNGLAIADFMGFIQDTIKHLATGALIRWFSRKIVKDSDLKKDKKKIGELLEEHGNV